MKKVNPMKVLAHLMHHNFYSKDCKAMSVVYGGKTSVLNCCGKNKRIIDQSIKKSINFGKNPKNKSPKKLKHIVSNNKQIVIVLNVKLINRNRTQMITRRVLFLTDRV
jgi:hypothetical protein